MKILFICRGNVGRSQIAEGLFNKLNENSNDRAISAGTKLSGPEQTLGELLPHTDNVLAVLAEEGIDATNYYRKQITEEMVRAVDKTVLLVDELDPIPEWLNAYDKVVRFSVPDPKGMSLEETRKVKDRIKEILLNLDEK